ncbi:TetR family transcriptional regulator [Sesbania bispinosa]|nr:TetR family transcriptional regulator [Sesbania bispinosa]
MNINSENNEDGFRLLVEDEAGCVFIVDENWVDKCVVEDEGENGNGHDKGVNADSARSENMVNNDGGFFFKMKMGLLSLLIMIGKVVMMEEKMKMTF